MLYFLPFLLLSCLPLHMAKSLESIIKKGMRKLSCGSVSHSESLLLLLCIAIDLGILIIQMRFCTLCNEKLSLNVPL